MPLLDRNEDRAGEGQTGDSNFTNLKRLCNEDANMKAHSKVVSVIKKLQLIKEKDQPKISLKKLKFPRKT